MTDKTKALIPAFGITLLLLVMMICVSYIVCKSIYYSNLSIVRVDSTGNTIDSTEYMKRNYNTEFITIYYKVKCTVYPRTEQEANKALILRHINIPLGVNKMCALSRDMLQYFHPKAPFKYGDTVMLSGDRNNPYNGNWIVADCVGNDSISNTIDLCIGKNKKKGCWKDSYISLFTNKYDDK